MTKPLTPGELKEVLEPNPSWWGLDAYPYRMPLLGMRVVLDPSVEEGTLEMRDSENGRVLGKITNICGEPV